MAPVLRCADLDSALRSLASSYRTQLAEVARALPAAVQASLRDPEDPINALKDTLAAELGVAVQEPETIHYFHGTRAIEPTRFTQEGVQPLLAVLDLIWRDVAALAPELSAAELEQLRDDLTAHRVGSHTYSLRVNGTIDHGPCGHLIREALLYPREYSSVDYLNGSEIPVDICDAARERHGLDLLTRYQERSQPCIVEFTAPATNADYALASAAWYVSARLQDEHTPNANWGYDGRGEPVLAAAIVSIEVVGR